MVVHPNILGCRRIVAVCAAHAVLGAQPQSSRILRSVGDLLTQAEGTALAGATPSAPVVCV
jgi:hypothetical protein